MINEEYAQQKPKEITESPVIKNEELEFTYNLGEMGIKIPDRLKPNQSPKQPKDDTQFEKLKQ